MSTAACAPALLPTSERARCTARSLIYLADLGTVPELVESAIENLRLLSHGPDRGRFSSDAARGLEAGIAQLGRAIAQRTLGLNLAEDRLLRIGLSLPRDHPAIRRRPAGRRHPPMLKAAAMRPMRSSFAEIIEGIHTIPSLPEIAARVARMAGDPAATIPTRNAKVIVKDAGMAAKMLRSVNSRSTPCANR